MTESKNIGIWLRVSTEMQVKDDSPEVHERRARMYAEAKGWNVITVYRLDALSGKSIMDYPETQRMFKDIESGVISGLIFSKLARLARNTKELLEISEYFRSENADLISLAESIDTSTPAGRLFFTIIAAMAQWEREEIADRVAKSVPIRANMGKSLGGQAIFGYKWIEGKYVVDQVEAPIRKLLYEIFLKTRRKKTTARQLNDMGYRTRGGHLFTPITIDRLLRDTSAKGIRIANYSKSLGEGKKWVLKPQEDWVEIPCEPIITNELWEQCNALLAKPGIRKEQMGKKAMHLLSGFITCSCGKKMYVYDKAKTYRCSECKRKILISDIEEIYHNQLKQFLISDMDVDEIRKNQIGEIDMREQLIVSQQAKYDELRRELAVQIKLRGSDEISKDDFAAFYQPVSKQLREIESSLPELQAELDFLKIQSLSTEVVIEEGKDLYARWTSLSFEERRHIVEVITSKIEVSEDAIDIAFSYLPGPHSSFQNGINSARNFRGSCSRST